jgi:biopolymer transport protein TolR
MKNGTKKGLIAEINVTPLVDVMLVLLIIFMITAPMLSTGLEVDLPETKAGELKGEKPLLIVIDKEGKVYIENKEIALKRLGTWLREAKKAGIIKEVNLKADERCPYGIVAKVLAEIQAVGITNIGLVTRPEKNV